MRLRQDLPIYGSHAKARPPVAVVLMAITSPPGTRIPQSPALLRTRLVPVTISLIGAQAGYWALAYSLVQKGEPMPQQNNPQATTVVGVGIAVAALFPPLSIWIAQRIPRPTVTSEWPIAGHILLRRFFTGFAVSQIASLIGLFLFFVYGRLYSIMVTAFLSSIGIVWHSLKARQKSCEFEQRQSKSVEL